MNLCNLCTNHETIPHYQNILIGKEDTRYRIPYIDDINRSLTKLIPRNRMLIKKISMIAGIAISAISALTRNSPLIALTIIICALIVGSTIISDYKTNKSILNEINQEINALFKKYSKEFTFLEQKHTPLITIHEEDFEFIFPYCSKNNPLSYKIREQTHFKLEGGEIGNWSVTPLKLTEICKINNAENVVKKYKPWIDLLIDLSKSEKVPPKFLTLVGKMGGFNRSLGDFSFYEGDNYIIKYQGADEKILCQHKQNKTNIDIKTTEECLAFVQQEFMSS